MIRKLMKICWPVANAWPEHYTEPAILHPYYGLGRYGYTSSKPRELKPGTAEAVHRFALVTKDYALFDTTISHVQSRLQPSFFRFIGSSPTETGDGRVDFTKLKPRRKAPRMPVAIQSQEPR